MNEYVDNLIQQYANSGVLIDANLLLLLLVGRIDTDLIQRFKRTDSFVSQDFEVLASIADRFSSIVTTPNILTEVSNLAVGKYQEEISAAFAEQVTVLDESYIKSSAVTDSEAFRKLGLSDAVICQLGQTYMVLTVDLSLYLHLNALGIEAVNFNHIRSSYLS